MKLAETHQMFAFSIMCILMNSDVLGANQLVPHCIAFKNHVKNAILETSFLVFLMTMCVSY